MGPRKTPGEAQKVSVKVTKTGPRRATENALKKSVKAATIGPRKAPKNALMKALRNAVPGTFRFSPPKGIDYSQAPLSDIQDIFDDIAKKSIAHGFGVIIDDFKEITINVGTMCSGTEAPLLAIEMFREGLRRHHRVDFKINHRFSAEIEPRKQAYIERNFAPSLLFRDLREMGYSENSKATNAYGSLVEIPSDIDILVAGFPCVDFSAKNRHKKGLEDFGESGDVLLSILKYAQKYQPAMIILENVEHADWPLIGAVWSNDDKYVKERLKQDAGPWLIWDASSKGYANVQVLLDTKHFYLPQTRRRGYMFLVRKDLVVNREEQVLSTWRAKLEVLKRAASVSLEAFLLPDDDPAIQQAKVEMSRMKLIRHETDWTLCKVRHAGYRREMKLGKERPLTKWVEGGTAICPDYWWTGWNAVQVERIWDTIDIAYLRNASQNFDALHVARVWELSQNVDYDKDTVPQGIVGCITPTGQPFMPNRGRPITGKETLALQGLPIQKLNLTKETFRELYDLAGNAMSSTVVASAMISAILAAPEALKTNVTKRAKNLAQQATILDPVNLKSTHLQTRKVLKFTSSETTTTTPYVIRHMAGTHIRSCHCESPSHKTTAPISICRDCGHRSCEKCGILPPHKYEPFTKPEQFSSSQIQDNIEKSLPMRIKFAGLSEEHLENLAAQAMGHVDVEEWKHVREAAASITNADLKYHSIKRSHCWTAIYEAARARLEMVINENEIQWFLYGKADPEDHANSIKRQVLTYPIARMTVHGENLLEGSWQFRLPGDNVFKLKIKGKGPKVPSWKSKLGLTQFAEEKVWSLLQIRYATPPKISLDQDVTGDYEHLPRCGTASSSLHKKLLPHKVASGLDARGPSCATNNKVAEGQDAPSLFFFLDRERIEGLVKDRFVFSPNPRRLEYQELRHPIAYLRPRWRPSAAKVTTTECHVRGEWVACNVSLQPNEGFGRATYAVPRHLMINSAFSKASQDKSHPGVFKHECRTSVEVLLSFDVPSAVVEQGKVKNLWRQGDWETVNPHDEDEVLRLYAWLFTNVKHLDSLPSGYRPLKPPHTGSICRECVPKVADTRWRWSGKGSTTIVPYEDALQAGIYERALKARPQPFSVRHRADEHSCGHLQIGLNLPTLSHRVCGKLGGIPNESNPELFWRLDTKHDVSSHGKFKRFRVKSNAADPAYDSKAYINEDDSNKIEEDDLLFGPELGTAIDFWEKEKKIKEKDREQARLSSEFPTKRHTLRLEQKRSLTWMLGQEADNAKPWRVQEVEEATLPTLGWRVEVRGTKQTRVWGGVLADTVGYGKTATTLALIHKQSQTTRVEAQKQYEGFISLKATLILVPPTLVGQWHSEVDKFLGLHLYKVLAVTNQTSLAHTTIADFENAEIVIVNSDLLKSDAYWAKVAIFAALPDGPSPGGRAFDVWHRRARNEIKGHIEDLKTRVTRDDLAEFAIDLEQKFQGACDDEDLVHDIPQKRLKGSKYVSWQQLQAGGQDSDSEDQEDNGTQEKKRSYKHITQPAKISTETENPAIAWKGCKSPCLEFFRYARVVIEEHTYVPDRFLGIIENLNAPRRWILSATPSLSSFSDIRRMARLIGADLGAQDETTSLLQQDAVSNMRNDKSDAERFRAYSYNYTTAWHETRHKHAQKFLDQFVRQNVPQFGHLTTTYLVQPVDMNTAEKIIHKELQAILEKSDMRIIRANASNRGERARQADLFLNDSKTGSEALLKSCSYSRKGDSVESIYLRRNADLEEFSHIFAKNVRHAIWLFKQCQRLTQSDYHDSKFFKWFEGIMKGDLKSERIRSEFMFHVANAIDGYNPSYEMEFYRKQLTDEELAKEKQEEKQRKKEARQAKKMYEEPKRLPYQIPRNDLAKFKNVFRLVMRDLRKNVAEYQRRIGSIVFIENLQELLRARSGNGLTQRCGACKKPVSDLDGLMINVACGHLTCRSCLGKNEQIDTCLSENCDTRAPQAHLKRTADFIGSDDRKGKSGSKVGTLMELIKKIPDDDHIIVFCHFEPLMHEVARALGRLNITHVALTESHRKDVWERLNLFQDTDNAIRVIILNSTNETAAGSNCQAANHVVFMNPIDATSQYNYLSSKTQCIGRALRTGQKKNIFVYNILALNTVDVDIYEHREQRKLIKLRGSGDSAEWTWLDKSKLPPAELQKWDSMQDWSSGFKMDFPEDVWNAKLK